MKLLVIHDKPPPNIGGMARIIAQQNAMLRDAGHTVETLVCGPASDDGTTRLPASGRRLGWGAYRQLDALLVAMRPDVIHVHSVFYALSPWLLGRVQRRVPLVYTLHDVTPLCPRETKITRDHCLCTVPQGLHCASSGCYSLREGRGMVSAGFGLVMRAWQLRVYRHLPSWIVPSTFLRRELRAVGIADQHIAVIPHFADPLPTVVPPPAAARLLFVGRIATEKGAHLLVEALERLAHKRWTLDIVGEGPARGALQQDIDRRGLTTRITLHPFADHDALSTYYAQSSCVIMPSLIPESFGLVGLEALAQGRPVIGFGAGGMREWLIDRHTGLIARWGDVGDLARCIETLLDDRVLCNVLGMQGRVTVERDFLPQRHLRALMQVFDAAATAFASRRSH